jgi:hypothetical protein
MDITRKSFLKSLAGAGLVAGLWGKGPSPLAAAQEASGATPKQARIADVEVFPFDMASKEIIRNALGTMSAENVLVRLRTADGLGGWGESSPYPPVTGDTQATNVATAKLLAGIVRARIRSMWLA